MTAPERIWATEFTHGNRSWTDNPKIGKYRKEMEYIRADLLDAHIGAALAEAAEVSRKWRLARYRKEQPDPGFREAENEIRALNPTALTALERAKREAWVEGLRAALGIVATHSRASHACEDIRALIEKKGEP